MAVGGCFVVLFASSTLRFVGRTKSVHPFNGRSSCQIYW